VIKQNNNKSAGSLRIIAGRWRGRKLAVMDLKGLRPTSDRIRETVFNWLQPHLESAICLDLFAGTGALGLEAASRGAKKVTLVELNSKAAAQLVLYCQRLAAQQCQVYNQAASDFLTQNKQRYDIIFIDPPYQGSSWSAITQQLMASNSVADNALIYLEYPKQIEMPALPLQWQLIKEKRAGAVNYCLFKNTVEHIT
jgi:16S rRNA (guanine966-N2)-methyltransferase